MKRTLLAGLAVMTAAALTACGGAGETKNTGDADTGFLAENAKLVQEYLGEKGTFAPPPTEAPAPEKGKRIALVSCGQVINSCAEEIGAADEAAKMIGWQPQIIDSPNGDPTAAVPGIKRAVADGVDAIFVYYIDCAYIKDGLEDAKAAGIPVIESNSQDCSKTDEGAESYFQRGVQYNVGDGSYDAWLKAWLVSQAQYSIDKLEGKADLALFSDSTNAASRALFGWVEEEMAKCTSCNYYGFEFPFTDIGTSLQGKAETFLLKNPSVNAILSGYGAILTGGVSAAASKIRPDALVSASDGLAPGIALMNEGKAQFGSGLSYEWEGFAAIDTINRVLHGQEAVNSGIGIQVFDEEHNRPAGDAWQPPYDFKSLYAQAWGIR